MKPDLVGWINQRKGILKKMLPTRKRTCKFCMGDSTVDFDSYGDHEAEDQSLLLVVRMIRPEHTHKYRAFCILKL